MKRNLLFLLFISLLMSSCLELSNHSNKNPQNYEEITPNLENYESYSDANDLMGSFSKRYSKDIITSLYEDAIKKDVGLKELNNKIENIEEIKKNDLEAYNQYTEFNTEYWRAVKKYSYQIKDSITHVKTQGFLNTLEKRYLKDELKYYKKNKLIDSLSLKLNDQYILIQLAVTAAMMENYRKNEHPSIEPLDNLIKKYEALIEETKEYLEIKK